MPMKSCTRPFINYLAGLNWGKRTQVLKEYQYLVGANLTFSKKRFNEIGGFIENVGLQGDNEMFCDKFSFTDKARDTGNPGLVFNPKIKVVHQIPSNRTNIHYFERRAYGQGKSEIALRALAYSWTKNRLTEYLVEQLFSQEQEWKKMNRVSKKLSPQIFLEYKQKFLQCRIAYLNGIKDAINEI